MLFPTFGPSEASLSPGQPKKHSFFAWLEEKTTYIRGPIQEFKTMAKKGNRVQVIMECTEHKESGMPGTSRYITTKNRKNTPDRLEKKKYNPILKKMTVHKEIK
jgi:large subunit ribosomal protein L33